MNELEKDTGFILKILEFPDIAYDILPKFHEDFYGPWLMGLSYKGYISKEEYKEMSIDRNDKVEKLVDYLIKFKHHSAIIETLGFELGPQKELIKQYIKIKFPDQFLSIFPEGESNLPQKEVREIHDLLKTYYNLKL